MQNDFLSLAEHLTERYTHYRSVLHGADRAIGQRDADALVRAERDSRTLLGEIQLVWDTFERLLTESPELEQTALPVLHRLRAVIDETRALARHNEETLALWMGELGHALSSARLRHRTLRGYDEVPAQRVLTLNA